MNRPQWRAVAPLGSAIRFRPLGGKPIAKANIAEKGKTQKAILRDFLTGANGRPKVDGWLPGWLEFPYRALGKKAKAPKPAFVPDAIAAE